MWSMNLAMVDSFWKFLVCKKSYAGGGILNRWYKSSPVLLSYVQQSNARHLFKDFKAILRFQYFLKLKQL